jgi:flagellar basal-body rod protein FlgB
MNNGIESLTTTMLGMALDAASLRHQAISANIANMQTLGYVGLRVNFESQLEAARHSLDERGAVDPFSLRSVRPYLEPAVDMDGQALPLQLDDQVAQMTGNAVQYQALLKGLSRHLSLQMMAASDGKK